MSKIRVWFRRMMDSLFRPGLPEIKQAWEEATATANESWAAAKRESARIEETLDSCKRLKELWDKAIADDFPRVKVWEGTKASTWRSPPTGLPPIKADLDDPLQQWLWKQMWDACAETGDWDLLTAAAGIARAARIEGLPMNDGVWVIASEHRAEGSE